MPPDTTTLVPASNDFYTDESPTPTDLELKSSTEYDILRVIAEESDVLEDVLSGPFSRIIGTCALHLGENYSLNTLAELDGSLGFFADRAEVPKNQFLAIRSILKGSTHASSLLIVEKMIELGTELNGDGNNSNGRDLAQALLSWSAQHLEHIYPTLYRKDGNTRRGREITLNQAFSSLIISGYRLSTAFQDSEAFTDVTDIERLKTGIYLTLFARYKFSHRAMIHILLSLTSHGIIEGSEIESLLPAIMRYGPQSFWNEDGNIRKQSELYHAFRSTSFDTAQALSARPGKSEMTHLELICLNYGWPFDPLLLGILSEQEFSPQSRMKMFWTFFDSLSPEPQRLSMNEISRASDHATAWPKRYIERAIRAIMHNNSGLILPEKSPTIQIPGRQPTRNSQEVETLFTEAVSSTITSLRERAERDSDPFPRFQMMQRIALMTTMQNIITSSEDPGKPIVVDPLHRKLSYSERDRIRTELDRSLTLNLHTAASLQYPTLCTGMSLRTMKDIVLETMGEPDIQSFKFGRHWINRLLILEALTHLPQLTDRFQELATIAAGGVSPKVISVLGVYQTGIPEEYQASSKQHLSYFRQFCALASLSAGIPTGKFRNSLKKLSENQILPKPVNNSKPAVLMTRLHNDYITLRCLKRKVPVGVMQQIISELCFELSKRPTVPLLDTLAIATAQGYTIQHISETIYPEQLFEASQRATLQYQEHPEDGFHYNPYSTLSHYLNTGRIGLLLSSIRTLPDYSTTNLAIEQPLAVPGAKTKLSTRN